MAHVNRRIGKSSETANVSADGTGGGVLDAFLQEYFNRSGNLYNAPGNPNAGGHVASGGIVSDYTEAGGNVYRAHVFTSSGTFSVTSVGELYGSNVEYLVVAGGGGGGTYDGSSGTEGKGGGGPNLSTPYAGAGKGGYRTGPGGESARANSGSGAGGGGGGNSSPGANGGSGIVIIAYPT